MNKKILANLCLFTTAFIWGIAFVAQVLGSDILDPFTFTSIRFGAGAISLLPVVLIFEKRPHFGTADSPDAAAAEKKKLRSTVIASLICGTILSFASVLQQAGAGITKSPGRAGFITDLYIILTPIFAAIFFKKKLSLSLLGSTALATVGIYLLCVDPTEGFSFGIGEALILIGAFFWAFHILTIDFFGNRIYPLLFSCIQFAVVSAATGVIAAFTEHATLEMVWEARLAIFFCGVLSVGVAYTLQTLGQQMTSPDYAALIFSLEAVFGAVGGFVTGQDKLSVAAIAGCILIFIGIVTAQLRIPAPKKRARHRISDSRS